MNVHATSSTYGELIEPATLKIQRVLPGPIERVWDYLTNSELRRKWLAAGDMDAKAGAPFELVWKNDELTDPPGNKPDGFGSEHRMQSKIIEADPPRKLAFEWQGGGDVTFTLESRADNRVLLTVVHRRLRDRNTMLMVSAGWHAHLDVLAAAINGTTQSEPFWDHWSRLKQDYDRLLPA
jgi:uncharacterized protein YndB with AHSA1/START domain